MEENTKIELLTQKFDIFLAQYSKDQIVNTEQHNRIETQTKKTNGSVAKVKFWQAMIVGGAIVVSAVLIPILLWLVQIHLHN